MKNWIFLSFRQSGLVKYIHVKLTIWLLQLHLLHGLLVLLVQLLQLDQLNALDKSSSNSTPTLNHANLDTTLNLMAHAMFAISLAKLVQEQLIALVAVAKTEDLQ